MNTTARLACACLISAAPLVAQHAPPGPPPQPGPTPLGATVFGKFRTLDGTGNNPLAPLTGATDTIFERLVQADYGDGAASPAGVDRPSARAISNAVCAQPEPRPNARGASDMLWQWGQFLDHDIDLTLGSDPGEPFDIEVPVGDPWFDPASTGTATIPMNRSAGLMVDGTREQLNGITAWIDGSMIYGSDEQRAHALRTLDGTGRLKTSAGELLPFNTALLSNEPAPLDTFFLAGDIRANEQVGLTALHTLFVREHNHWADRIARADRRRQQGGKTPAKQAPPALTGDQIYQRARALVGAEIQAITYREFLPVLLGEGALPPERGYDPTLDASIRNSFATAGYRVGHTMLASTLLRLDKRLDEEGGGHLPLADAFFAPDEIVAWGIEGLLRGLAHQQAQEVDAYVVDDVRNFLFGPPGAGGFDLAALNIQRGRDHGLPSLSSLRTELGLAAPAAFDDVCSDPEAVAALASVYATPAQIDPWVGALAEDHVDGAMVGPTLRTMLVEQFTVLRDGDRFWYRRAFPKRVVRLIERQNLARIIRRNTSIGAEIPSRVFLVKSRGRQAD